MSVMSLRPGAPIMSPQWFRLAGLRPRLEPQTGVDRLVVRGDVWHVLVRADGMRSFRLNAAAWAVVARCDGQRTVQQLWQQALAGLGDAAPTQDELLDILARLHAARLMSFDRQPDFGGASVPDEQGPVAAGDPQRRNSLLAWRFPLGSPDDLLARWAPRLRWLFTPAALAAWVLTLLVALLFLMPRSKELEHAIRGAMATPHVLWIAALAYPVIKAVHELAHGLAARHFGARVPEWGVSLLMFAPVPYVDASAASALPRHARAVVAAAGIVVELALAALAAIVAFSVQPGALRDGALAIVFLCALSTLAVNANPLLRFDGYHLLCDALELPNLAARSARHWLHALRTRLLGVGERVSPVNAARGEQFWLWLYAPLSLAMRWIVALSVIAWLGSLSFVLGVTASVLMAALMLGQPLRALWRWLQGPGLSDTERGRTAGRLAAATLVLGLPLLAWPWPDATVAQGVLWMPERALVRAEVDGRIDEVRVRDGQPVRAGDVLLRLQAPDLQAQVRALQARIDALVSEHAAALRAEPERAVAAAHALSAAEVEWAQLEQRLEALVVRAQADGTVAITRADDLPGRHVQRGTLIAHLMTGEAGLVKLAVPNERAALVAGYRGEVQVRRASAAAAVMTGQWTGASSGGGAALPHASLAERHGGRIATDPDDRQGLKAAQAIVLGEVRLEGEPLQRLGERVLVRFPHGHLPLAAQGLRWLQQQVLRHFHPSS